MHAAGQIVSPRPRRTVRNDQPETHAETVATTGKPLDGVARISSFPSASSSGDVSADKVLAALENALRSPEFQSAPQLQAFLNFIVRTFLDNNSAKIKGYTIAVEALGRPEDFNPVTDPIVRVEAARLRRRLETYYTGSGACETVRIIVLKGTYTPKIVETVPVGTHPHPPAETQENTTEKQWPDFLAMADTAPFAPGSAPPAAANLFTAAVGEALALRQDAVGSNEAEQSTRFTVRTAAETPHSDARLPGTGIFSRHVSVPATLVIAFFCLSAGYLAGIAW